MRRWQLVFNRWLNRKLTKIGTTRLIALAFAVIILAGTLLLMTPAASRSGLPCSFRGALFTATSATCVTGLTPFDTWSQWSGFGQIVILCMIELGGLGFMSAAALVIFVLRKKVGLRQRMLMAQALSVNEMEGVVKLQKWVLGGSLLIQLTGAGILFLRFLPDQGVATALKWGVFHSVSAFCNAGFDLTGVVAPGANLNVFNDDPVVCITVMALVVLGGLGFFVWEEVATVRSFRTPRPRCGSSAGWAVELSAATARSSSKMTASRGTIFPIRSCVKRAAPFCFWERCSPSRGESGSVCPAAVRSDSGRSICTSRRCAVWAPS